MPKLVDPTIIVIWLIITLITLITLSHPRINKTIVLLTLYAIFGRTYFRSIYFVFGCIKLYTYPSNKTFCNISRTIFPKIQYYGLDLSKIKGKILLCNYPQFNMVEYFTQGLLPQNYVLVINKKSIGFLKKVYPNHRIIGLESSNTYDTLKNLIRKNTDIGYNILTYFDTKPIAKRGKEIYRLNGIRKGVFNIAKDLEIEIVPVVMDRLYISNGIIHNQKFNIYVGDLKIIKDEKDIDQVINLYNKKLRFFKKGKINDVLQL